MTFDQLHTSWHHLKNRINIKNPFFIFPFFNFFFLLIKRTPPPPPPQSPSSPRLIDKVSRIRVLTPTGIYYMRTFFWRQEYLESLPGYSTGETLLKVGDT